VLERSAVAVGAPVGGAGQELAHQRGLRALHLHALEPGRGAAGGDVGVPGDQPGQVGGSRLARHLAEQRVGHRGRRDDRRAGVQRVGLPAVVVDLREHRHAVRADRLGDPAHPGQDGGVVPADQFFVGPVGGIGRALLGDDQPGAAGRAGRVVGGVPLGEPAVDGVVGQVGGEDEAVGQRHRSDPQRRGQVLDVHPRSLLCLVRRPRR
jgi:hypothetical protein